MPYAVSDMAGYMTFFQRQGHSDSAATSPGGGDANTIVESIRLSDFIADNAIRHAFIKLDTENLEPRILCDIGEFLTSSVNAVGFEFQAHHREMYALLPSLLRSHVLFDIGYLPKPFCFRQITAGSLEQFTQEVENRPYGYTDVLAVSRNAPELERLVERLSGLKEEAAGYSLVY